MGLTGRRGQPSRRQLQLRRCFPSRRKAPPPPRMWPRPGMQQVEAGLQIPVRSQRTDGEMDET